MKKIQEITKVLTETNAKNIKVYDFEQKSPFFDYVIVATVNPRQSNAIVGYLKDAKILDTERVEGRNTGWTLIDLEDTILHLFSEEQRAYYNFDERLLGIKLIDEIN